MLISTKSVFWFLINVFIAIVIIGGLFGIGLIIHASNAIVPSRTVSVTGEGKIRAIPDIAKINFSVISQGTDPKAIQAENTAKMNKAIEFVKAQGVAEKDITTSGYNLYPRYDYNRENGTQKIIGYELSQTVTVKIRDLTKSGDILGGLPGVGINQVSGLQFAIDDPEGLKNQARAKAFADARGKAEAMAQANGVRLARVVTFSESNGGYPIPYMFEASALGKGASPSAPPDIQPGEQEITVDVNVTYELR